MKKFFEYQIEKLNLANIATLDLKSINLDSLDALYSKDNLKEYPDYLKESCELRKNPLLFLDWAQSAISIAVPFTSLPSLENKLPENKNEELNGIVSGYANRLDYHIHGKVIAEKIMEAYISKFSKVKYEICIDTKPVAERAIAKFANLGDIGKNKCLLINNWGASCFLITIFLDCELPQFSIHNSFEECDSCKKCLNACPTKSLNKDFQYTNCISALTIEQRGELSNSKSELIENNIFGCSNCITACKNSNLPKDKSIDLEWLLMSKNSEIKEYIKNSPLEYTGITTLRRNAIYALKNKNSEQCIELVNKFQNKTGSAFLKNL